MVFEWISNSNPSKSKPPKTKHPLRVSTNIVKFTRIEPLGVLFKLIRKQTHATIYLKRVGILS